MNTKEQYLSRRVKELEARLQASMVVIDHLIQDLEMTESVGAAFAFELGSTLLSVTEKWDGLVNNLPVDAVEMVDGSMSSGWDEAVKALEESQKATQP